MCEICDFTFFFPNYMNGLIDLFIISLFIYLFIFFRKLHES